ETVSATPGSTVAVPGDSTMIACPSNDELLRFLDGELVAEEDARIVAHVEDCGSCQEQLECLTAACGSSGRAGPIDTVRTGGEPTTDLPGRELVDPADGASTSPSEVEPSESTDQRDTGCGTARVDDLDEPAIAGLAAEPVDDDSTVEPESG